MLLRNKKTKDISQLKKMMYLLGLRVMAYCCSRGMILMNVILLSIKGRLVIQMAAAIIPLSILWL